MVPDFFGSKKFPTFKANTLHKNIDCAKFQHMTSPHYIIYNFLFGNQIGQVNTCLKDNKIMDLFCHIFTKNKYNSSHPYVNPASSFKFIQYSCLLQFHFASLTPLGAFDYKTVLYFTYFKELYYKH